MKIDGELGEVFDGVQDELPQREQNEALLSHSELGEYFCAVYQAAMGANPALADVAILPIDPEGKHGDQVGFYSSPLSGEQMHTVSLRLGDAAQTALFAAQYIDKIPLRRQIIAERLGVANASTLTPLQLHAFVMLHELGHADEMLRNNDRMEELLEENARIKAAIPLGGWSVVALLDKTSDQHRLLHAKWQAIGELYGVSSPQELIELRVRAYCETRPERNADEFAARVLAENSELMYALAQNGPVITKRAA